MYTKYPKLISSPVPSNLSGFWDTAKDIASAGFSAFTSGEQAKGAANALALQQQAALSQQGTILGMQPMTLLLLGGLGVGVYMLVKRKKSS